MSKNIGRIVVTLVLLALLVGAFVFSMRGKQASDAIEQKQASMVTLKGLIGLDVEPILKDPRVIKLLEENNFRLDVLRVGSRDMAAKVKPGAYDFYFPTGIVAANQIADAGKKVQLVTTSYSPFYTPMVVASWVPIAKLLTAAGVVTPAGDKVFDLNFPKLTALMLSKKRWNELPNNKDYDVSRSILVSTTDVRKSNSASLYLALTTAALNNNEPISSRETAQATAHKVAELFTRQGYQENYINGTFEDYVSIGIGKTPLAFIYENQLVTYAINKKGLSADMVMMYPKPTIFNKEIFMAANDNAKRLGELFSNDPKLRAIAIEYGFRTSDAEAFNKAVAGTGLAIKPRLNDIIDPPSYEILSEMIEVIAAEMKQ